MIIIRYLELSKEVSYALRHSPDEYELELDENGWVNVQELFDALKQKEKWASLELNDLFKMVEAFDKKRHQIVDNKIRALYGHSTSSKIKKNVAEPPDYLYHGTASRFFESIKEKGLLSQERQYVHLSQDKKTAYEVGKRRDDNPVILTVLAKKAWKNDVRFYNGNENIWLSDYIPSKYIIFS